MMENQIKKLNLGCGAFPKPGYVNVDLDAKSGAELIWDLNKIPYPFENSSFQLIAAEHVLEHLNDPLSVMKELGRILAPGGELLVKVPHFSRGFTHPGHQRGFDVSFPYYFRPDFKGGFTGQVFELERLRLTWFAQEELKKTVLSSPVFHLCKFAGRLIDFFANLSPQFCSRCWVYWVGGFDEIEFRLTKPSSASPI